MLQVDINKRFTSDDYQLIKKIGQGGFGSVFRAKKLSTNQVVAIKFLSLSSELEADKRQRYIDRFHREASLSSLLQHKNIVRLLDKGGCDQDLIYAVFEFVEGTSLKEVLQTKLLSPTVGAGIMSQVLEAMIHAHDKGVIHRDLKPANIMLSKSSFGYHVKILDFGIATLTHEARHHEYQTITLTHETLGTPSYCAPEQLRGEPPTTRSDLYVWGLVFLECLTGKPTVTGTSLASVFHQQLSQSDIPLPIWIASHPFSALLRRVLNKKSLDRYSNASNVYTELLSLNFSTLVSPSNELQPQSRSIRLRGLDETIINVNSCNYTALSEKKPLSVLCISLTIQSLYGENLDLEIIEALHRDQKIMCVDIAARFGGFHVGSLGDTVMFYFGYPQVSDNDGRLCVRTALEINSVLLKRNALLSESQGVKIAVRMGLHTGLVTHYLGLVPEGEVVNVAMELARNANFHKVYCSGAYKKLLDSYIEFSQIPSLRLGARQLPEPIYLVISEKPYESMGMLQNLRNSAEVVGRKPLLDQLQAFFQGSNQFFAIHLHGEAGVGKSRLLLEAKYISDDFDLLYCQCLPEQKYSGLTPILNLLKNMYSFGVLPEKSIVQALKQSYKLAGGEQEDIAIPILCSWLNIQVPPGFKISMVPVDQQKEILFNVILLLLLTKEPKKVKVLTIEDLHWADATSVEFISYMLGHSLFGELGGKLISTSRLSVPESLEPSLFNSIEVTRLDYDESNKLIASLFGEQNISPVILKAVNDRADGVPLYIEELVAMLKSKNITHQLNGSVEFINSNFVSEIPETLLGSLQQKLDGLVNAKESAQLASAIGRSFDYQLLIAVSNKPEEQVQSDLTELISQEVIYLQRHVSGDRYIFKHALVRDAVYKGMNKADSAKAHSYIASWLDKNIATSSRYSPSEIADHYEKAGDYSSAIRFGNKALLEIGKVSSNQQVLHYSELVGGWLERLPNGVKKLELKLELYSILLPIKTMHLGWGDQKIQPMAEEGLSLIKLIEQDPFNEVEAVKLGAYRHKFKWIIFISNHLQSNRVLAKQQGEELLNEALSESNRQHEVVARSILGQIYYFDGDFEKAKGNFSRSIDLYDNALDQHLYIEYVIDPYLFSSGNLLLIESLMGNKKCADHYCRLCMEYAEATKNITNIATAYTFGCLQYFIFSDRVGLKNWASSALNKYGEELESSWIYDFFYMLYEWSIGEYKRSEEIVKEQLEKGQSGILSWYEPSLADTYISNKMYPQAISLMNASVERASISGESCILPLSYRYLAKAHYLQSGFIGGDAKNYFKLAISLAQENKSNGLEIATLLEYKCSLETECFKGNSIDDLGLINERLHHLLDGNLKELLPS